MDVSEASSAGGGRLLETSACGAESTRHAQFLAASLVANAGQEFWNTTAQGETRKAFLPEVARLGPSDGCPRVDGRCCKNLLTNVPRSIFRAGSVVEFAGAFALLRSLVLAML